MRKELKREDREFLEKLWAAVEKDAPGPGFFWKDDVDASGWPIKVKTRFKKPAVK